MPFNYKEWIEKGRLFSLYRVREKYMTKYDDIINKNVAKFGLDPILIEALIMTESSFNERAYRIEPAFYERYIKNHEKFIHNKFYNDINVISASYGLCQIMFTTFDEYGYSIKDIEEAYNPEINIMIACKILSKKIKIYGLPLGILAYNGGSPHTKDPLKESNLVYLRTIAKHYKKFGGQNQTILQFVL